jgi:REP element-mobilizing transposase RayT
VPRRQHYNGLNHLHYLTANIYRRARIFDSDRFKLRFIRTLDDLRAELVFRIIGWVLMPEHCHLLIWPSELAHPSQIMQMLAERTANFTLRNLRQNLEFPWCQKMLVRFELPPSVHHHAHYRVWQRGGYDLNVWSEKKRLEKLIAQRLPEWESTYGIPFADDRVRLIIKHALDRQTDVEAAVEEVQAIQQAVQDFAGQFSLRNDLEVSFSDGAVDALAEKVWKEPQDPADYLKHALHNYDHGLKLIREKTGKRQFLIPAGGVDNPEHYLNCLIQEAYRQKS